MSPDPSVPDQISQESLQQFLLNASSAGARDLPIGAAVPRLPLSDPDFGAADLVVALEQLLAAAGGANSLHLMHASSFLLSVVVAAMERRLEDPEIAEIGGLAGLVFLATTRTLIRGIVTCISQINDFIGPLTVVHAESVGGGPGSRKGIVSDGTLTALGLDIEEFDRRFKRSAS
jgi:hypothetical protein